MDDISRKTQEVILRLRKARESRHLSQLDLSLSAGVSQVMISQIESGQKIPTLTTLIKICEALGINPSILFSPENTDKREIKRQIIEMIEQNL